MDFWDSLFTFLHIKDYVYLISSPELQDYLFPVKLIFVLFSAFFFVAVIYFMVNSTWLKYRFLEDVVEFFSWQSYGEREIVKQWNKIKKRLSLGVESEYKLAIIEADDFLQEVLIEGGYEADSFEESIKKATRLLGVQVGSIHSAHDIRNAIVYNPDYGITQDQAKEILGTYESAINSIGLQ